MGHALYNFLVQLERIAQCTHQQSLMLFNYMLVMLCIYIYWSILVGMWHGTIQEDFLVREIFGELAKKYFLANFILAIFDSFIGCVRVIRLMAEIAICQDKLNNSSYIIV